MPFIVLCFLQLPEQAPEQQLSAEGMLSSLKRAKHPPQAPFSATLDPSATMKGRTAVGTPDPCTSWARLQRPNVRKRFERVMASQISTLNRLISSATATKDL